MLNNTALNHLKTLNHSAQRPLSKRSKVGGVSTEPNSALRRTSIGEGLTTRYQSSKMMMIDEGSRTGPVTKPFRSGRTKSLALQGGEVP